MALIDDIFGIILVVFFLIIVSVILTSQILSDQSRLIDEKQENYLFDYYSTSVNAFINVQENRTGVPMHILLSNYVKLGEEFVFDQSGEEVNIVDAGELVLDELFGEDNYYLELRQTFTNTTISFVLDGSPSNAVERETIKNALPLLYESLEDFFDGSGVQPIIKIYILGEGQLCTSERFSLDNCVDLSFDELYSNPVIGKPIFSRFSSYDAWDSSNNKNPDNRHLHFMVADWMAGTAYAEDVFLSDLDDDSRDTHIIIPVSDQLSTGSIADVCYSEASGLANYFSCRLCELECPVGRSNRSIELLMDLLYDEEKSSSTYVLPVFSLRVSFPYFDFWNTLKPTGEFSEYYDDSKDTKCDIPSCTLCDYEGNSWETITRGDVSWQKTFVKHGDACAPHVQAQMNALSNDRTVSIEDIDDLTESILSSIQDALNERSVVFGSFQEARTRYVFERTLVLPDFGEADIALFVYELPGDVS